MKKKLGEVLPEGGVAAVSGMGKVLLVRFLLLLTTVDDHKI
jgi:hypothetical protein